MALSTDMLSKFVKVTNDKQETSKEATVSGTAVEYDGRIFVRIDGSDRLTPVSTSSTIKDNDRVSVLIKDHTATVTGNTSDPSASSGTVTNIGSQVEDAAKQITEFEIIVAARIKTDDIEAINGYFDRIKAKIGQYTGLEAVTAEIETLQAKYATMEHITATDVTAINAEIEKIQGEFADFTQITTDDIDAINGEFDNLKAYNADFTYVSADKLTAINADIVKLQTNKLSATDADVKYANISFSNINQAAVEKLFSDSGIIKDLVVSEGKITGELVGVTIKGDIIEGGTVKADKLVIKGSDGLFYKLNTDGVTTTAEQTNYNSLSGTVITAQSITAEKISVDDLVAFDATIGGFNITESAIYSGVKSSADNTTRGIYLDRNGQLVVGDSSNYLKYYQDADGTWKLAISAGTITLGGGSKTVEDAIADTITSSVEEFYLSDSPTSLSGGSWSTTTPNWTQGKYIWRRTAITYGDGSSEYTPNQNGVCITGNTGESGNGINSTDITYQAGPSQTSVPTGTWSSSVPTLSTSLPYLWTKTVITYTDNTTSTSYSVSSTLDGFEIGGRNLIKYSQNMPLGTDRATSYIGLWDASIGTAAYTEDGVKLTFGSDANICIGAPLAFDGAVDNGETFTLSFDYRGNIANFGSLYFIQRSGDNVYTTMKNPSVISETDWNHYTWTTSVSSANVRTNYYILLFYGNSGYDENYWVEIKKSSLKLEKGNKATDWTPAPEDVEEGIDNAQSTADNAYDTASQAKNNCDYALEQVNDAKLIVDSLNSCIASLVVGEDGTSLMTQGSNGWQFNIGTIQDTLYSASDNINELTKKVGSVEGTVSSLETALNDLGVLAEYVRVTTYYNDETGNTEPCVELGESDSEFKLLITNTRILFQEGSNTPTYIKNNTMMTNNIEVKNDIRQGNWIWSVRSNGNYGLSYKS